MLQFVLDILMYNMLLNSKFTAHLPKQLRLGSDIPHQALAADVHITRGVKIFCCVGVIGKWCNNTDTIPIDVS